MGPDSPFDARLLRVGGRVQGVGFRPFVYRLASRHGLTGSVCNSGGEVVIHIGGPPPAIAAFARELIESAPPLARPRLLESAAAESPASDRFEILESRLETAPQVYVPPDQFCCEDCLRELRDPGDRRYRYPFINCTQCGPRYTLIRALPYDRPNTSMVDFPLCADCRTEYEQPADRRYHAEPTACPVCGPSLTYRAGDRTVSGNEPALDAALEALRDGAILAVKGVGGYHLLCDATDGTAVARLRERKPRPHKPLAVMFPQQGADGMQALRSYLEPDAVEAGLLRSPQRPIVLLPKAGDALAANIAPGLDEVGAMLPYSPLHHLLLDGMGTPLVATSGNSGGDPVITDPAAAEAGLARVADAFLHHDRPILRPADDAVFRVIAGRPRPLRLGRGVAPLELQQPCALEKPVLAVGGHMKNCIALAWEDRLVLSPHIGDLESRRSREVFDQVIADLQRLYGVQAEVVVHDAHRGYASSRWAEASGLPTRAVFHHHAHASALYGEHHGEGDWLVFTWDGVGLGEDGTLWGGEALLGRPGRWRRAARLRPFRLPGGDRVAREPWRTAAALCWETQTPWPGQPASAGLLHEAWQRRINAPITSAAGRLFDGAAALLGLVRQASFEGQGPMQLEAIADASADPLILPCDGDELLEIDWRPLLPMLLDEDTPVPVRAGRFHASLAAAVATVADRLFDRHRFERIGLTGGVFQNRRLTELVLRELAEANRPVALHEQLPCNDAGLAYGQIAEYAADRD